MLRSFVKCACIILASPLTVSAAFFMADEGRVPLLSDEISYRDDATQSSSFEKIRAESEAWVSQKEKPFRAAGEPVHIWIKINMPVATEARRVLIRTGAWESAEYFVVRDGQLVDRQKVGTLVPWAEHKTRVTMTPAAWHAGFVAVDLSQARTTVYARLANENHIRSTSLLQFSLWDEDQVREGELRDRLFQGAFVGVMLFLVLYNLVLFALDVRELSYLYFVIFTAANTVAWGILYGLPLEFLWPDRPAWDLRYLWIAFPLGMHSFVQFARHYLHTDEHFPSTDVLLKWIAYAVLILLPAFIFPLAVGQPVSLKSTVVAMALASAVIDPLLVGVSILALIRRHPFAPLFAAAIFCYFIGAVITFGAILGFIPEIEFTQSAGQVGTVLLAILFSLGLDFRMPRVRATRVGEL
jgi:7TM diverse intracellular signalling/7TMR-DISM extracellular 2